MKRAEPSIRVDYKSELMEKVLDELSANPNVWFDVTDERPLASIRSALYYQAARRYTPLEVTVRGKAIYARWASEDKA